MDNKLVEKFNSTNKEIAKVEAEVMAATATLQKRLTTLREQDATVRAAIKEAMIKNNVKKFDSDNLTITLISASTRRTLDTAAIKEKEPAVYEKYLKETPVAASVRINVKK